MWFHFMVNNISYFLVYPLTTGLIPQIEETIKMLLHNRKIHWGVVHTGFHAAEHKMCRGVVHTGFHAENLVNRLWNSSFGSVEHFFFSLTKRQKRTRWEN